MSTILLPDRMLIGDSLSTDHAVALDGGRIAALIPKREIGDRPVERLSGTLCPGFVDLQVNGGGGHMISGTSTPETLSQIGAAHARLGATTILPTLITDTPDATRALIRAACRTPGLEGLHLEGPHLDPRRAGAHDPALIRPMSDEDLERYIDAKRALKTLKITVAPASATVDQVSRLTQSGVLIALGHADCRYDVARAYHEAGASIATHLFNAMSQLGSREPGLVGAALDLPIYAGLIADGIHVHPASARMALATSDRIFLVTDAMAVSGAAVDHFWLQGRRILRRNGRLTLEDGTLAGADLTMAQAVRNLITWGTCPVRALNMATRLPADLISRADLGRIASGLPANFALLDADWALSSVWKNGLRL
jgi:N-acetylglucosamine-6-phosphate deacetylase